MFKEKLKNNNEEGALPGTDSIHIADPSKFSKSHFLPLSPYPHKQLTMSLYPSFNPPKTTPPKTLSQTLGINLTTHKQPTNNQLTKSSIPVSLSTTTTTTFYHHFYHQSFPPVFHQKLPTPALSLRLLTAFSPPSTTSHHHTSHHKFFHLLTTKPLPYSSQKFSGAPQKPQVSFFSPQLSSPKSNQFQTLPPHFTTTSPKTPFIFLLSHFFTSGHIITPPAHKSLLKRLKMRQNNLPPYLPP